MENSKDKQHPSLKKYNNEDFSRDMKKEAEKLGISEYLHRKPSQKILNSEDFYEAMRQEAEKSGTLDKLKPMPSQPTDEYTVTFRPFAEREKCDKKRILPRKSEKVIEYIRDKIRKLSSIIKINF